ncbi:DUF6629 family protein [Streptomyces erythrochromogenes]|uniref:DUF6629 family protein n=1 Tax=Streptomyces erythrochromogenes TaxID=285574 RepID=UPI00368C3D4C
MDATGPDALSVRHPGRAAARRDRRLRTPGRAPAAGAPTCSAPWRLEPASTRCAFAAVAPLLVPGRALGREPAVGDARSTESYLDVCSDFTRGQQ